MEMFFTLLVIYAIGSFSGWIIELFYRRYFSTKKWINPGFLYGPTLPLYGVGFSLAFVSAHYLRFDLLCGMPYWASAIINIIILCLIAVIVEYITGIIFIKGMGIKLWDYTNEKYNIQGIICLKFSIFWLLGSAVYYFTFYPLSEKLFTWMVESGINNIWLIFFLGIFYGILIIDEFLSFHVANKIRKFASEHNVIVKFENLKSSANSSINQCHWPFFSPIKMGIAINDHLKNELKKAFESHEKSIELENMRRFISSPKKKKDSSDSQKQD